MSAFLSGIWAKLLAGLAIVGGILLAIGKLKQAGRDTERADQAKRNDELRRQADATRADWDAANSGDIADGVRKWTRD